MSVQFRTVSMSSIQHAASKEEVSGMSYEVAPQEVADMCKRVLRAFPDQFAHIKFDDITFVIKKANKSRYLAAIHLFKGLTKIFTQKKLGIVFWYPAWYESSDAKRALIMYHELCHAIEDQKHDGEYKLLKHDVEDFGRIISQYGIAYEKADAFLKEIENFETGGKAAQQAVDDLIGGNK